MCGRRASRDGDGARRTPGDDGVGVPSSVQHDGPEGSKAKKKKREELFKAARRQRRRDEAQIERDASHAAAALDDELVGMG